MTPLKPIRHMLTALGVATTRPWAFLVVAAYAALWLAFDARSLNWHGLATLATWLMTVFIQRAEHRDTQAIQAKLDRILAVVDPGPQPLAHIDELEPEEIEARRDADRPGP